MIDLQLIIDLLISSLASIALIAGITPPSPIANKQERSKASKDFISKYGLASTNFVNGIKFLIISFCLMQSIIILKANNQLNTLSNLTNSNSIQFNLSNLFNLVSFSKQQQQQATPSHITKTFINSAKVWLSDENVRSKFRIFSLLSILGGIGRVICFRTLGHFFTFDLSIRENHKVIQSGPYAYVRHPSYTAIIILIISSIYSIIVYGPLIPSEYRSKLWKIHTAATGILFVLIATRIRDEERMLQKEMGKEYKEYMKKVPNRLIPFVF